MFFCPFSFAPFSNRFFLWFSFWFIVIISLIFFTLARGTFFYNTHSSIFFPFFFIYICKCIFQTKFNMYTGFSFRWVFDTFLYVFYVCFIAYMRLLVTDNNFPVKTNKKVFGFFFFLLFSPFFIQFNYNLSFSKISFLSISIK